MVRGAMAVTQPPSFSSRLTGWLVTHLPATVVTLTGILAYSVLRVSYATFYGRFDVEPEEVGLGQTEIIAHTALALFVSTLIVVAYLVLTYPLWRALGVRPYRVPSNAPLWRRVWAFTSTPYWYIVVPPVAVLAFLVLVTLPGRAGSLADQVERGQTVRPPISFRVVDLHVKALPVTLRSLGGDRLPAQLRSPSLRYLGEAGGALVLYDWRTERVIRLPVSSVVVMTSN
jgi:hypothetical protein